MNQYVAEPCNAESVGRCGCCRVGIVVRPVQPPCIEACWVQLNGIFKHTTLQQGTQPLVVLPAVHHPCCSCRQTQSVDGLGVPNACVFLGGTTVEKIPRA